MIGTTSVFGPSAYTKEWFKYGGCSRTDTWTATPGHFYLVGVSAQCASSENSQPHTEGLEIIKAPANSVRTGASGDLLSNGWLIVVRATASTVRMNCRPVNENINLNPDHNGLHWIDIGTSLPTDMGINILQSAQTYTLSSLIVGHYYAVFVNALHSTGEYFTVFLRHHFCKDILHTDIMEGNGSNSLVTHGVLGIIKAEYTSAFYILRNSASNSATYNSLTWLDLGTNFIHEF